MFLLVSLGKPHPRHHACSGAGEAEEALPEQASLEESTIAFLRHVSKGPQRITGHAT